MSQEKFIEGKHDDGKHDGRYASVRHLAETDEEIIEFWMSVWPELVNYILHGEDWDNQSSLPPKPNS